MASEALSGKSRPGPLGRLRRYGELVLFSHTLFSLPFGLLSMLWTAEGLPDFATFFWILLALIGARNGANAFNRIADLRFDQKNPRTSGRPLADGRVSLGEAVLLTIACFALLIFAAAQLNRLCLLLSPLAVGLFLLYSYTKRFTCLCHFFLGLCCGGAPVGAALAVEGRFTLLSFLLGGAVLFWVAGFDILYALQDIDFDRQERLHSVPARFGQRPALLISAGCHILAVGLLAAVCGFRPVGGFYWAGLLAVSLLLLLEHMDVEPRNPRRMRFAAYHLNQMVSLVFFFFALLDMLLS